MRLVVVEAIMRGSSLHLFHFLLLMVIPLHNMCDSPNQETHYNILSHFKYRASSLIQHLDGYKMTELCFIYCVIKKMHNFMKPGLSLSFWAKEKVSRQ